MFSVATAALTSAYKMVLHSKNKFCQQGALTEGNQSPALLHTDILGSSHKIKANFDVIQLAFFPQKDLFKSQFL